MFIIGAEVIKTNKKGAKFKGVKSYLQHPLKRLILKALDKTIGNTVFPCLYFNLTEIHCIPTHHNFKPQVPIYIKKIMKATLSKLYSAAFLFVTSLQIHQMLHNKLMVIMAENWKSISKRSSDITLMELIQRMCKNLLVGLKHVKSIVEVFK